ncbi:hypothetical protein AK88_05586 [Plasmodium fragile]|uniref:Uncharacterized protein n=1 Tax=Plasmodium fragile TaxID=5857 RepID=A0A0D9QCK6_PLAFR|nr:uncharacterized protein AK88_05586 [Plasmodium fragile]KJP84780.1 hypothetical protein AK88_05586 [Plasmodium fragile]
MMFPVKLSIFSIILYSCQYPEHANELVTSWKHSAEQHDTVGIRMRRLLTVEVDMQAPPQPNNTLLLSPGKGPHKKVASGQKPGKSGKPKSKVGEAGSLPPSPQDGAPSEHEEKKHGGNAVKSATDKQTPEQNKSPVNPNGGPLKEPVLGTYSGKSQPKAASEGLQVASQNKAHIKETSEQTRGLCSTLARTLSRNKWWIPATLAVLGVYIATLPHLPKAGNLEGWIASLLIVIPGIALTLLVVLFWSKCRKGRSGVPKKALKGKIASEADQKPKAPKTPEIPDKQDAPKTDGASEKPETPKNPEAPKKAGESDKPETPKESEVSKKP